MSYFDPEDDEPQFDPIDIKFFMLNMAGFWGVCIALTIGVYYATN